METFDREGGSLHAHTASRFQPLIERGKSGIALTAGERRGAFEGRDACGQSHRGTSRDRLPGGIDAVGQHRKPLPALGQPGTRVEPREPLFARAQTSEATVERCTRLRSKPPIHIRIPHVRRAQQPCRFGKRSARNERPNRTRRITKAA